MDGTDQAQTLQRPSTLLQGQTSEMEWEDTLNNADTSSDTTTNCSSDSDLTDKEQEVYDDDPCLWKQNLQHVNSVMNNLASSTDKGSLHMTDCCISHSQMITCMPNSIMLQIHSLTKCVYTK